MNQNNKEHSRGTYSDGWPIHPVVTSYLFDEHSKKTLLLKHRKLGVWLPPGGHVNELEDPFEAALRELKEETGFSNEEVEVLKIEPVNLFFSYMADYQNFHHEVEPKEPPFLVSLEIMDEDSLSKHYHLNYVYFFSLLSLGRSPSIDLTESDSWMWLNLSIDQINLLLTFIPVSTILSWMVNHHISS
ncbi:NUDIX domain-containing protein [Candidatus Woesebacteria bacterium]|nr:NUDIX domain-containing protein [Candidatus Woesebacteria bacterium]MCB9801561.1 NUDIX domain-containing protein [Pseudomonadales bacterium]